MMYYNGAGIFVSPANKTSRFSKKLKIHRDFEEIYYGDVLCLLQCSHLTATVYSRGTVQLECHLRN